MLLKLSEGIYYKGFRWSRAPQNKVRRPCRQIAFVIARMGGYYRNNYAFPSQAFILDKLDRWFKVKMARRTLCRHMNALQEQLWLKRTRRIEYRKRKGLLRRSTLYHLGARYYSHVGARACDIAKMLSLVPSTVPGRVLFIERLTKALHFLRVRAPPHPA